MPKPKFTILVTRKLDPRDRRNGSCDNCPAPASAMIVAMRNKTKLHYYKCSNHSIPFRRQEEIA